MTKLYVGNLSYDMTDDSLLAVVHRGSLSRTIAEVGYVHGPGIARS